MVSKFVSINTFFLCFYLITAEEIQLLTNNLNIQFLENNSYNTEEKQIRNLQTAFICKNPQVDCSGNGICTTDNKDCLCNFGYYTNKKDTNPVRCDYLQKLQLNAFLLELFVGFGAGHFYSERYLFASLKLIAFLFGIYIICLFPITAKCISDRFDSDFFIFFISCFYYICAIGLAFWFVWDLVMFGMNKYADGNGNPLLNWGMNKY